MRAVVASACAPATIGHHQVLSGAMPYLWHVSPTFPLLYSCSSVCTRGTYCRCEPALPLIHAPLPAETHFAASRSYCVYPHALIFWRWLVL